MKEAATTDTEAPSQTTAARSSPGAPAVDRGAPSHRLLAYQRILGNQAVLRRMGADSGEPPSPGPRHTLASPEIQRAPETTTTDSAPATTLAPAEAPDEDAPERWLVSDDTTELAPGQMRKTDFMIRLRSAVCATATNALAGTVWSVDRCPWIDHWLQHFAGQDAEPVEAAARRFAPAARNAGSAADYIPAIQARVEQAIRRWRRDGEDPDRMPTDPRSLLGKLGSSLGRLAGMANRVLFSRRRPGPDADPEAVRARLGTGRTLDPFVQRRMERAFGASLGPVRVHDDATASRLTRRLGARAFTVGRDVAFGPGQYRPGTPVGDALLAHELAHVLQQKGASATSDSAAATGGRRKGGSRTSLLEQDANQAAAQALLQDHQAPGGDRAEAASVASASGRPRLSSGLALQGCIEGDSPADLQERDAEVIKGLNLIRLPDMKGKPAYVGMSMAVKLKVPDNADPRPVVTSYAIHHEDGTTTYRRPSSTGVSRFFLKEGDNRIIAQVRIRPGLALPISFTQKAIPLDTLAKDAFDQQAMTLQPDLYVAMMELQLAQMEKQPGASKEDIDKVKAAIARTRQLLEIPKVQTPEQAAARAGKVRPIRAVLIPHARPIPVPLMLYLMPGAAGTWKVVDVTNPAPDQARSYEGSAPGPLSGAAAQKRWPKQVRQMAAKSAWANFVANNTLPAGRLEAQLPEGFGFQQRRVSTTIDGKSTLEEISDWLSAVGLLTGLAAITLTVLPIPGSRVVAAGLLITSAATGATAAGLRIADRVEHGNFQWNGTTALDLLDLAGSLAIGAGTVFRLGSKALTTSRLGSAVLIAEGVDTGSDLGAGIVLSALHYRRIQEIRKDKRLTDAQKEKAIQSELQSAAASGGLIMLGIVGGRKGRPDIDSARMQKALNDATGLDDQLRSEILNSTGLQRVLLDQDYDPQVLMDLWRDWKRGQTGLKSKTFTEYVGYRGHKISSDYDPSLNEVIADFDKKTPRERSLLILSSSDPDFARLLQQRQLPAHLQTKIETEMDSFNTSGDIRLSSARGSLVRRVNEILGQNIRSLDEFAQVVGKLRQPGSRGSVGEYFFQHHLAGDKTGLPSARKPTFTDTEVPGLSKSPFQPDRMRPVSGRTLDVKVGYADTDIDVDQMRNYNRLIQKSQEIGSPLNRRLRNEFPVGQQQMAFTGLRGHDYLFLPTGTGSAKDAAARAWRLVQREGFGTRMNVYYAADGKIWKYNGPRAKPTEVGATMPD